MTALKILGEALRAEARGALGAMALDGVVAVRRDAVVKKL